MMFFRVLFAFLFLIPAFSFASDNPIWVESEGEAVMGEIETQKEVKGRAKIDAQNKAVEKADSLIRSEKFLEQFCIDS